jgi:hypothetical protein
MNHHKLLIALLIPALTAPALAQSISPVNKYAWGENIGFLNFADAGDPAGSQSVFVNPTFLEGFVWGENIGWINLGDGSPANGPYANTTGLDFGVNRNASTATSPATPGARTSAGSTSRRLARHPPNPARIESGRFRGYAWGENIGWINLDDPTVFVALACSVDYNNDGILNFFDVSLFLTYYNASNPLADLAAPLGTFNFFDAFSRHTCP